MSIIPAFDGRWYTRINIATAFMSTALAFYWGVYEFVITSEPGNRSNLDAALAIAALVHAVYGLTLYHILSTDYPRTASFISFMMFNLVGLYSVWITRHEEGAYFGILISAALLSGIFGWLVAVVLNSLSIAVLVLLVSPTMGAPERYSIVEIVIFAITSVMSIVVWSALPNGDGGETSVKKPHFKRKSAITSASLSTDVLINSIADGVAIINNEGIIQEFNPSAEKITGWSAEEAIGLDHRSVFIILDEQGKPYDNNANLIGQALASAQPTTNNNGKLQTRSKKQLEVDVIASPIVNGNKVEALVIIFRDVSKQRSEERQRAEFISTASHEMRTPVAAIEGYLALAMNEKVAKIDSVARSYLDKAHASTQHLGQLFQDLLTAAKSEDGRLTNNPEPVELGQTLDELIEGMRFTAEKKGLLMEANFGQGVDASAKTVDSSNMVRPVAYVFVDPERLREVITNLFDNAIKYTEDGKISIGMHADEKQATISVTDTGSGIPKEDIPHLFQKFYRVDNSATRQIGGTGLGLFICRKIVELYNGRLWVESELGEGSTFNITLPRLTNERAQELIAANELKKSQHVQDVSQIVQSTTPVATPATDDSTATPPAT